MSHGQSSNEKLRILHLTSGSDPGGVSRYLHDLCNAMTQEGHNVAIAGQRGSWHELFENAPWPWVELPLQGGPVALWRAAGQLKRYLREHPVDLLHCHYRKASLVARKAAKALDLPVLFTLHLTGIPMGGLWGWLSDFGDHAHAPSQHARRWLIDHAKVDPARITVIPHGVDPRKFPLVDPAQQTRAREQLGLPQESRVAAYVGRLEDPKNEAWLIDLAVASQDKLPDLKILMAGEGPHEEPLRRRIREQRLSARVLLLGRRDPLAVYQAADAVLLPSAQEGFSLVCAEAMCVGRPVLRTRTAGTEEMIIEGVTGRSVPIDQRAFLDAAIPFLADRPALGTLGANAARHIRQNLTFDRQVERTLELYRSLIRPRKISR